MWSVFHAARERDERARAAFLDDACAGDNSLRERVEALLRSDASADERFLDPIAAMRAGDHAASWIGRTIGRFAIIDVIAEGGMGIVFRAMQDEPRREVAIKVMKSRHGSRSSFRRFKYEARVLAALEHENIARIYETGTWDDGSGGVPYFAMELVSSALPITQYAEQNHLPLESLLELLARVCDGVQYGHQKSVIHRDIKPANILVGSSGVPKIIDFGVARATDSDLAVTTQRTGAGELIGTLHYMSPEQCDADPERIDTRSDVYSLGVVLYELIAGRLPYDFRTSSILDAARTIREERPHQLAADVARRDELQTILDCALAKDQRIRYQSAAELGADIRRFLHHEPLAARPPSRAYRFRKFIARNKAISAALAAVVVLLISGTIVSTALAIKAMRAERTASERSNDLREASLAVITGLHDQVLAMRGTTEHANRLAEIGLTYLNRAYGDAPEDPEIRLELAAAYETFGLTLGDPRARNLGKIDDALSAFDKALAHYESLRAEPLHKNAAEQGITRIHHLLALVHRTRDPEKAIESWRIARDREATRCGSWDGSYFYTAYAAQLAEILTAMGRTEERDRILHETLEHVRSAIRPEPRTPEEHYAAGNTPFALGDLHRVCGRFESAIDWYSNALACYIRAAEGNPSEKNHLLALGNVPRYVGICLFAKGNYEAALASFRESIEALDRAHEAHPEAGDAFSVRSDVRGELAVTLARRGDINGFLRESETAASIRDAAIAADPRVIPYRESAIDLHAELADEIAAMVREGRTGPDRLRELRAVEIAHRESVLAHLGALRDLGAYPADGDEIAARQREAIDAIDEGDDE